MINKFFYLLVVTQLFVACSHSIRQTNSNNSRSGWVTGDFHEHSYFSDGGYPMDSVFYRGANHYGVNFMLNTDHGGRYPRNYDGKTWDKIDGVKFKGSNAGVDKEGKQLMWRWQELLDYSYPHLATLKKNNINRHIIQGLEWNSPATSHTTVGILANTGLPIASFEYQFDYSDLDTSGGPARHLNKLNGRENGYGKMLENKRDHTSAAISWLAKNHPNSSWAFVAHPERGGNVTIGDLRAFNNAGPDVAFGFEGIPGHQKNTLRAIFYPQNAAGAGTYGGVGYFAAKIGGVWDAMLSEGRHFWLVTSSDFHGMSSDFWPGEYHRTWIYAKDTSDAQSVLAGMRKGKMYVCNGGLINALEIFAMQGNQKATLGETLHAINNKPIDIVIRFRTHKPNYNGQTPKVNLVHLITGEISAMKQPGTPDFEDDISLSTKIEKTFLSGDWKQKDGWNEIRYQVKNPAKSFYFRTRGTNHFPSTPYETDKAGSPLIDSLATKHLNIDGAEEAWADLWFYSNPIFININ